MAFSLAISAHVLTQVRLLSTWLRISLIFLLAIVVGKGHPWLECVAEVVLVTSKLSLAWIVQLRVLSFADLQLSVLCLLLWYVLYIFRACLCSNLL
jgi:hypothetical protein